MIMMLLLHDLIEKLVEERQWYLETIKDYLLGSVSDAIVEQMEALK